MGDVGTVADVGGRNEAEMIPSDAQPEFESYVRKRGNDIGALQLSDGVKHALSFYRDVRAEGCRMDMDGDMLLYQWGTNDWGNGEFFDVNVTRQLITSDGED